MNNIDAHRISSNEGMRCFFYLEVICKADKI